MERAFLEQELAAGRSLEQIGRLVGRDASTVGYWVRKHGLVPQGRNRHAPRGGIPRELLHELVDGGFTVRQIAERCGVSFSTVRHWLNRYDLRTARARQEPPSGSPRYAMRRCHKHGTARFIRENRGYYRCTRCRAERVAARRRRVKEILVQEAGGRCVLCGYDRCIGALQFHHVDPAQKSFGIARGGVTRGIAHARTEVAKCVLVCANCHAELEAGAATLHNRLEAAA